MSIIISNNDLHGPSDDNDDEVDWLECISAIETDRGTIFFCDRDLLSLQQLDLQFKLRLVGQFGNSNKLMRGVILYSITGYNPMNKQIEVIQNVQRNTLLQEELRNQLPGCQILNNYSFFPRRPKHFERGFTVQLPIDYFDKNHNKIVCSLAEKYHQAAYFRCVIHINGEVEQTLVLMVDNEPREVNEQLMVIKRMTYHPAFMHHTNHSVFHDYKTALDILSRWKVCSEVDELLSIVSSLSNKKVASSSIKQLHPVIAVEGPKLKGINAVCNQLSTCLGAVYLPSTPMCISHLKKKFDAQPQLIRGAFYAISNYVLGQEITKHAQSSAVFVDRYWNSTAAHSIVNEVGEGIGNLPPKNHVVYNWPVDLPKPTTVVLVSCKKKLRNIKNNRICLKRGKMAYENMVFETFRRMRTSSWIEVDCSKQHCYDTTDIVSYIIDKLHDKKVISVDSPATLCPSVILHPTILHDTLPIVSISQSNHLPEMPELVQITHDSCMCPSMPRVISDLNNL